MHLLFWIKSVENKVGIYAPVQIFIPFGEVFKAQSQLVVVSVELRITWDFGQEDLSDLKWTLTERYIKLECYGYLLRNKNTT